MLVTQYDVFGRVTATGWKAMTVNTSERTNLQNNLNANNNPFVLTTNDFLTKNYYDNYTFAGAPTLPTTLPDSTYPIAQNVKGMATGSWVRVLDSPTGTLAETSFILYDDKYRPVRTSTKNHLGGYTFVDSNLDFMGKTNYTITAHKRLLADNTLYVKDMFTYSAQDRLILQKQQINSLPEQLIAKNNYDELGQLISKNIGGTDTSGAVGLQKVDYTYNVRGWLKGINETNNLTQSGSPTDLFSFQLNYNNPVTADALFNGNISESLWKTNNDNVLRKYDYSYDHLNRLLGAVYSKPNSTVPVTNSYNEHLLYDKNGNITDLKRNGEFDDAVYALQIDKLQYTYHPTNKNQLMKVLDVSNNPNGFKDEVANGGIADAVDDYSYDFNGNMSKDDNKGITRIVYNHLNLPTKITFGTIGIVEYLYNATGQKVQKKVTQGSTINTTDYLTGGFQYKDKILQFFPHAEGYVSNTVVSGVNNYNYVFNYTDHLGNIRLSYAHDAASNSLKILEESNYYPFGMKQANYNWEKKFYESVTTGGIRIRTKPKLAFQYKFQEQERQDELGLNWDSYKYRNYDYAIGRFFNIDPLSEDYAYQSTYAFAENKVISHRELEGLEGV
jgi:RHS repeat-associated protein